MLSLEVTVGERDADLRTRHLQRGVHRADILTLLRVFEFIRVLIVKIDEALFARRPIRFLFLIRFLKALRVERLDHKLGLFFTPDPLLLKKLRDEHLVVSDAPSTLGIDQPFRGLRVEPNDCSMIANKIVAVTGSGRVLVSL